MKKDSKSFAVYCSGGASRVVKFYSFEKNLLKYRPRKVIYDGLSLEVSNRLRKLFAEDLIVFDSESKSYNPDKLHGSTSNFIESTMIENSIEYLLSFGDKIMKKSLVEKFDRRLINFHPSILPAFKGLLSINQAIDANVSILGNTAHFIDNVIDSGEIIIQTAMLVEDFEDNEDVLEMQFPMMKLILRDILNFDVQADEVMSELIGREKEMLIPRFCIR